MIDGRTGSLIFPQHADVLPPSLHVRRDGGAQAAFPGSSGRLRNIPLANGVAQSYGFGADGFKFRNGP